MKILLVITLLATGSVLAGDSLRDLQWDVEALQRKMGELEAEISSHERPTYNRRELTPEEIHEQEVHSAELIAAEKARLKVEQERDFRCRQELERWVEFNRNAHQ
jgi:hypothetical protein